MEEKCRIFSLYQLPQRLVRMVILSAFLLVNCLPAMAQTGMKVKGVVTASTDGLPLIGVNVAQKGTTNGTVTDFNGTFELTVPVGAELDFSYIGYLSQGLKVVSGKIDYTVMLKDDSQSLDEVVVMGYGVQKKKLVTGATVQVSGDNLQKLSTSSALGALQSQTPGVNITQSSGMPGEGFKVTVRGLGTVGSSSPLYVIDGVAGGDINNLNPSDIESIDVLKDAASAAIYGARAANGVILVTTKQGKSGKMQLTYDGYWGVQNVYRMPGLLNANEYMTMMNETRFNEGNAGYDWSKVIPNEYAALQNGTWGGTNWMEEVQNKNAQTQNHAVNLTGGSDQSKFALGFSYASQDGILGKPVQPNYERYTARVNSEHILLKIKELDVIRIGENLTYSYKENSGIGIGNQYWNDIHNMLVASPLMPVYNSDGSYFDKAGKEADQWTLDGNMANPVADMVYRRGQNLSKSHALQANAYIDIQPIKNLKLRSSFGYKMSASSYRQYTPSFSLSNSSSNANDDINQNQSIGYSWTWENTAAYFFTLNDQHAFDVVLGQSMEKWGMGEEVRVKNSNSLFPGSFDHAWINNTQGVTVENTTVEGYPWGNGSLASFFGRINYNYKETYMASLVMRSDGSSNFARGNRWGYFPSVSAGWVMTNEAFMNFSRPILDFFKLRASWGQNGNADIANFQYLATVAFDNRNAYFFGDDKKTQFTGGYADILPNTDISWETSEQLDFGFDARLLNSRLGIAFDWYKKTTKDWLVLAPTLASYGTGAPYINGGDVQNSGVELALTWNDNIGDFTYGVNLNMAHNKNEVTRIANSEGIIHGPENVLSQGTKEMYRAEVGFPIGYFWGYKTNGIFQNAEQVAVTAAKIEGAQPGDVIFADANGDGAITDADKVMMGNPHPDLTMGLTLALGYKGFDLALTANGAFGQQIAKSYRSFADSPLQNFTTDIFNRWHGEGTSNTLPRLTSGSHTNWQTISDIYIEDGDYVKMQNITLGYDFKKLFPKMPLGQARLYLTAQNLFTITGYSGMDPEIGYSPDGTTGSRDNWVSGIDLGFYPSPRTYLVGVNLKF